MKIGIIGCGYVFDHYMATWSRHPGLEIAGVFDIDTARLETVCRHYRLRAYPSREAMLADPAIAIIVNLTSIEAHFAVTSAAIAAGKHVYSEKPLVTDMAQARELFALADAAGVRLSCAPCNALGDSAQTLFRAVADGLIGEPRLIYAEFDDNVIYRMHPETWRSRTGAPWPYLHEYESGCTYEHVGYHLTVLCSIFGPVESVTAFSKVASPDKTDQPLSPPDTPDFSVACLNFASGVAARVTCSIGVPYDHRVRIIGNEGMLTVDTYRHYQCPIYLERFTQASLNARKAIAVRTNTLLQALLGARGRQLRLLRLPAPGQRAPWAPKVRWWHPGDVLRELKRRQLGQQDKVLGIAELADAIAAGRPAFPSPAFTLHLTELTIAIQNAGIHGLSKRLETTFTPVALRPEAAAARVDYRAALKPPLAARLLDERLVKMHAPAGGDKGM